MERAQLEALARLNADYREALFRRTVRERQGLYILASEPEGPLMLDAADEGGESYPPELLVWSHSELAELFAGSSGAIGAVPRFVTAGAWNEHWVGRLRAEGVELALNPVAQSECSIIDPCEIDPE